MTYSPDTSSTSGAISGIPAWSAQAVTARRVSDEELAVHKSNCCFAPNSPFATVVDDLITERATTARLTVERDCLVEQVAGLQARVAELECGWPLRDQFIRYVHFVELWINRPNLTDAERVSVIKHRPKSRAFAEATACAAPTPEPPAQAGGEKDADFVDRVASRRLKFAHQGPMILEEADFDHLITIARRAVR